MESFVFLIITCKNDMDDILNSTKNIDSKNSKNSTSIISSIVNALNSLEIEGVSEDKIKFISEQISFFHGSKIWLQIFQ